MKTLTSLQYHPNRRDFLKSIAILSAAYGLPFSLQSCQSESTSSNGTNYFDVLRQVREGLQQSPDFLPKRAEKAIASKDVEQIFRFVRDAIQTLPNSTGAVLPNKESKKKIRQWNYRWGIEGCLRYGAGTFYEKAGLLEYMLKKAGFSVKVKKGDFDIEKVGWNKVFFSSNEIPFKPKIPNKLLKMRFGSAKKQVPKSGKKINLEDERLEVTLKQMMAELPDGFVFPNPDWTQLTQEIFEVELTTSEGEGESIKVQKQILNPNIADAPMGKSYIVGKQSSSKYSEKDYQVSVKLHLGNTKNPYRPKEFIKCQIPLRLLLKNQLCLSFQTLMDVEDALKTARANIKILNPTIALVGESLTDEEKQEYTFSGKTIHLNGQSLEIKDDKVLIDGKEILEKGEKEEPELRQKVAKIEMEIKSHSFPMIRLDFNPLDTTGNVVESLNTLDFVVLEENKIVNFEVIKNTKTPPQVLLVFDLSGSVPEAFREEGAVQFGNKLVENIQGKVPNASFKVAWYDSSYFKPLGKWESEPSKINQNLNALKGEADSASYLWKNLLVATTTQEADVVVFVTDGISKDKLTSTIQLKLPLGCPAVVIGAGKTKEQETLNEMARLTNGITKTIENHEEAIEHIRQFLDKSLEKIYSLQYTSTPQGKKEHTIALKVKNSKAEVLGKYLVPKTRALIPGWTGIYLELKYYSTTAKRCLAGLNLYTSEKRNPLQSIHLADTEAALFGTYKIKFEGQTPTTSILLDELIGAKLSQEKFSESLSKMDVDQTFDALEEGFLTYPDHYLSMQQDFNPSNHIGKDFVTYSDGICATIYGLRPRGEDGRILQTLDILPLSQWRTLHKDPKKGFAQTMRHSLRLMNLEAKIFPQATMNLLEGKNLERKDKKKLEEWLREKGREEDLTLWRNWKRATSNALGWNSKQAHFFLPKDKSQLAYYTLDGNSGTVMALMNHANGGGVEETNQMYARVNKAVSVFAFVMARLGASTAFGFWVQFEKEKMKWLQKATIAIITMEGMTREEVVREVLNSICNMGMASGGNPLPEAGQIANDVADILGWEHIEGCGTSS